MNTRVLPAVILTAATAYAGSPFVLADEICDHFEDPALPGWETSPSLPAVVTWDDGDVLIRNVAGGVYGFLAYSEPWSGDISIRAVATIQNGVGQGELDLGYGEAGEFGYVVEFWTTGRIFLRRWDGTSGTRLADETLVDFDAGEPHVFQLDVSDDRIEARVWNPGAPMPLEPSVQAEDTTYREGLAAIGAHFENPTEETQVRYQFACISSDPREPENWSCDEFDDPALDGWEPLMGLPDPLEVEDGELLLRNVDGGTYGLLGQPEQVSGDTSVRVVARFEDLAGTGELDLGYGVLGTGYIVEFYSSGEIIIVRWDSGIRVELAPHGQLTSFDPAADNVFQLDVRGDRIEARVWGPPGVPVPLEPAVVVADDNYRSGQVAIGAHFPNPGETTLVRFQRACWLTTPEEPPTTGFLRGDCDGDGEVCSGVSDSLNLFNWLFLGGPRPTCPAACDLTDPRGELDLTDGIYGLSFCFLGGSPPPEPYPECGPGTPADEEIGCAAEACP